MGQTGLGKGIRLGSRKGAGAANGVWAAAKRTEGNRRGGGRAFARSAATAGHPGDFLRQGFAVAVRSVGEGRDSMGRVRGRAEQGVRFFVVLDPVRLVQAAVQRAFPAQEGLEAVGAGSVQDGHADSEGFRRLDLFRGERDGAGERDQGALAPGRKDASPDFAGQVGGIVLRSEFVPWGAESFELEDVGFGAPVDFDVQVPVAVPDRFRDGALAAAGGTQQQHDGFRFLGCEPPHMRSRIGLGRGTGQRSNGKQARGAKIGKKSMKNRKISKIS